MSERGNSKPARRWRTAHSRRNLDALKLDCRTSDRVAVVYVSRRPYSWGIYGHPNENGHAHATGQEETVREAKAAARRALDEMADYPAWLEARS